MAEDRKFTLRIIAPDRVFYQGEAQMAEFNTTEGEIGVLPGHIPMTVIISPGVLKIHEEDEEKHAALHAGFAEILPEQITILAEIVEWSHEIDEQSAQASRQRAEDRLRAHAPDIDVVRAEASLKRALARIESLK
jgi:F-type H+-transporting ATPase subunit epsilon